MPPSGERKHSAATLQTVICLMSFKVPANCAVHAVTHLAPRSTTCVTAMSDCVAAMCQKDTACPAMRLTKRLAIALQTGAGSLCVPRRRAATANPTSCQSESHTGAISARRALHSQSALLT